MLFIGASRKAVDRAGAGMSRARPRCRQPRRSPSPRVESVSDLDRFQYLLLMAGCLLITLPLELVLGVRVYRRPAGLALALLPVVIIFSIWDIAGILRDHWTYSARFTTGWKVIFSMPVEELSFFVVVPICGLLSYEAVGRMISRGRSRMRRRRTDADA